MSSEDKPKRLRDVAKEYNIATSTIKEFFSKKGVAIDNNPNAKFPIEYLSLLDSEFKDSKAVSQRAEQRKSGILAEIEKKEIKIENNINNNPPQKEKKNIDKNKNTEGLSNLDAIVTENIENEEIKTNTKTKIIANHEIIPLDEKIEFDIENAPKILGKINLSNVNPRTRPEPKNKEDKKTLEKPKKDLHLEKPKKEKFKEKTFEDKKKPKKEKENKEKQGKKKKYEKQEHHENVVEKNKTEKKLVQTSTQKTPKVEVPEVKIEKPTKPVEIFIETKVEKLTGPTVLGKIELKQKVVKKKELIVAEPKKLLLKKERKDIDKPKEKHHHHNNHNNINKNNENNHNNDEKREKRKRIDKVKINPDNTNKQHNQNLDPNKKKKFIKPIFPNKKKIEISDVDIQKKVQDTLAILTAPKQKSKTSKYRKEKRENIQIKQQELSEKEQAEKRILKVTEYVTASEFANMMEVQVTEIISKFMDVGKFISINQRLEADDMVLVASEFNFEIEFVSAEILDEILAQEDAEEDLLPRPPIVTVMGHVDHGKTKLLDFIRQTNVVSGEAGGITQHIGAYSVNLEDGRQITFLDTPGHEAFTAMRARGTQITDVAIIMIAADDNVMPQTVEAINHASAASVPIVFAINKIDQPAANPDKIKEQLSVMNYLVEDWGGKYQSQEISAKKGINIDLLMEKVLLEAEILELKANPNKNAIGTVIESSLDKGRGYLATLLVQAGTLKIGDFVLAGSNTGKVKAMFNERGQKVKYAGPSTPVVVLGLNGAPQAGDKFNVMSSETEAKNIAAKRQHLQREQNVRTQKHITLEEIGRRIALGKFYEINLIVKGDVDGSVEALSDSLIKLSTENFSVNIIHKAVGQIIDSDVSLADASNAIIIGFNVRPTVTSRKLAEQEGIEIRTYSIIYDAIEDTRSAMKGMLSPVFKETIVGSAEVLQVYKIDKVGNIAGCVVTSGRISKNSKVHIIRNGSKIYTGELASLKHFKDDAKEVVNGNECGLNIAKYNDIKVGDVIEAFERTEETATL